MNRPLTWLLGGLLAANALLFAYGKGWLGGNPGSTQREPARLAAQVQPEALEVLSPEAAAAARKPLECREIGPFNDEAALTAAEAALFSEFQFNRERWQRRERVIPGQWLVATGPSRQAAELARTKQSIERLGLKPQGQRALLGEAQPSWLLGRYDDEAAAKAALKAWSAKGLRPLRVVVQRLPSSNWMIRLPAVTAAQAKATHTAWPGGLQACATGGAAPATAPAASGAASAAAGASAPLSPPSAPG